MEVTIRTAYPEAVDPEEIATALIDAGYYVHLVVIHGPEGDATTWRDGND